MASSSTPRSPDNANNEFHMLRSPVIRGDDFIWESQVANDVDEVVEIIYDSETRKYKIGIILICIAVITWLIGLELVNSVLKDDTYQKPFLFTYIIGSCFIFNLVPDILSLFKRSSESETSDDEKSIEYLPLTGYEVGVLSVQAATIYFIYNVVVMTCLKYTSASNQTVLASTTSIFTLVMGSILGIDSFSKVKVMCIFASFAGVVLVNISERQTGGSDDNKFVPKNPRLGNVLAIVGAFMYACYLIIMKLKIGTGNRTTNERRLFGFIGLATIVLGAPVVYLAHIFDIETFDFPPPNNQILYAIVINGVFSYISDYTTALASLLTSPLITSLSLNSSIPITIFIDFIVLHASGSSPSGSKSTKLMYGAGILSILISVILINLASITETAYIDEVIDENLEHGIKNDEVLSPLLSPVLIARKSSSNFNSPLIPLRRENSRHVSHLSLEGDALINKNHNRLYTTESGQLGHFTVSGGNNHVYHIKQSE